MNKRKLGKPVKLYRIRDTATLLAFKPMELEQMQCELRTNKLNKSEILECSIDSGRTWQKIKSVSEIPVRVKARK